MTCHENGMSALEKLAVRFVFGVAAVPVPSTTTLGTSSVGIAFNNIIIGR